MCGSVRFQPEQICAVTDSISEQQWSVRSISNKNNVNEVSEGWVWGGAKHKAPPQALPLPRQKNIYM